MTALAGRVALVTGGGRDVGADICRTLAESGATIAVNYNSSKAEAQAVAAAIVKAGGRATAFQADVSNLAQLTSMVAQVKSDFGGLDILVNNAGYVVRKRFLDSTLEEWRKQIDACLYGAIHCCHAAGPLLQASRRGRIISIVGDSSRVGESSLAIVAAARAGTIGLMKSLAREWGRSGCNTLALGPMTGAGSRKITKSWWAFIRPAA